MLRSLLFVTFISACSRRMSVVYHAHPVRGESSAGLTIVAIARGPALLGAPRSFVSNLFFIICRGGY